MAKTRGKTKAPEQLLPASEAPVVYADHGAASKIESFRKPTEAIFVRPVKGRLTLALRKGYNVLIKHAQEASGQEQGEFMIHHRAFVSDAVLDTTNYEYLKDLGRRYVSTLVEWDSMSDEGRRRWGVAALLSRFEIVEGNIIFAFDKKIQERLLRPEIYARISLAMQNRFRSSIALALYEVAVRYATNPSRLTNRSHWSKWRAALCTEEVATYKEFKYFNRVLKRAISEVNSVSDLDVQCIIYKDGRTVTDLQFRVTEKKQKGLDLADPNLLNSALTKKLIDLGLKPKTALEVMTEYDEAEIESALANTKDRANKKGVPSLSNAAAWFMAALKGGYSTSGVQIAVKKEEAKNNTEDARRRLLEHFYDVRAKEAEGLFGEISTEKQNESLELYEREILPANKALSAAYRKSGIKTPLVRKSFFRWFGNNLWGEPTDTDLLNFSVQSSNRSR